MFIINANVKQYSNNSIKEGKDESIFYKILTYAHSGKMLN
jgi:hypothetical protein